MPCHSQTRAPHPYERAQTLYAQAALAYARSDRAGARAFLADVRTICMRLGARPLLTRADALAARLGTSLSTRSAGEVTTRERDVLRLAAQGLSNPEIARCLSISEHTVHRHVANILTKLDLPSRTAAVAYAIRHHIL